MSNPVVSPSSSWRDLLFQDQPLSPGLRSLLDQQEYDGARVANRFRYVFMAVAVLPVYFNAQSSLAVGNLAGAFIDGIVFLLYLALTISHTLFLSKRRDKLLRRFSYVTIVADHAIFTVLLLLWWIVESPEEYAYHLKNPTMLYYLFPIMITVFQFRLRLVAFSFAVFVALYSAFLAYGAFIGFSMTQSWREYVLGPGVILADAVTTRPAIYFCVALSIGYAIYRSVVMVKRISVLEAQKASLSRYFSPAVVHEITKHPEIIEVGRRLRATVLFCDIRGFTALSEQMDPAEIGRFLGEFRQRLTAAVFAHGGMIDKYIGDAIMAVFGAPHPSPEAGQDSAQALAASNEMLDILEQMNRERESRGAAPVRIGIGLHCGELFAGNIGGQGQIEYTVIGDVVNTASRIEGLCRELGASLLVSRQVHDEAGGVPGATALPPTPVKGKTRPLELFRVR